MASNTTSPHKSTLRCVALKSCTVLFSVAFIYLLRANNRIYHRVNLGLGPTFESTFQIRGFPDGGRRLKRGRARNWRRRGRTPFVQTPSRLPRRREARERKGRGPGRAGAGRPGRGRERAEEKPPPASPMPPLPPSHRMVVTQSELNCIPR